MRLVRSCRFGLAVRPARKFPFSFLGLYLSADVGTKLGVALLAHFILLKTI